MDDTNTSDRSGSGSDSGQVSPQYQCASREEFHKCPLQQVTDLFQRGISHLFSHKTASATSPRVVGNHLYSTQKVDRLFSSGFNNTLVCCPNSACEKALWQHFRLWFHALFISLASGLSLWPRIPKNHSPCLYIGALPAGESTETILMSTKQLKTWHYTKAPLVLQTGGPSPAIRYGRGSRHWKRLCVSGLRTNEGKWMANKIRQQQPSSIRAALWLWFFDADHHQPQEMSASMGPPRGVKLNPFSHHGIPDFSRILAGKGLLLQGKLRLFCCSFCPPPPSKANCKTFFGFWIIIFHCRLCDGYAFCNSLAKREQRDCDYSGAHHTPTWCSDATFPWAVYSTR